MKILLSNRQRLSILILIFIVAVGLISINNFGMMNFLSNPDQIKVYIGNKGILGMLIFILLQIVQIVIAIIPGEPIQLAGGYIYGGFLGFVLSTIGIMIGSVMAFFLSRKFGFPLVCKLVKKEKLIEYKRKLESKKGSTLLFILCFIPGVPKDVLVYAVGLTPFKFKKFLGIYFVARIPTMLVASYMGAQFGQLKIEQLLNFGGIIMFLALILYLLRNRLSLVVNRF